jgi:SAM-dependent methyltransferase
MPVTRRLPRRGPLRALIKRIYYSPAFRGVALAPIDAVEGALGLRPALLPPRRLRFVGGRGDFHAIGRRWRDYLIAEQDLGGGDSVLEIGSGAGRLAIALADVLGEDGRYEGFDIVPAAIRWCQEEITPRYPNVRFEVADIHSRQYNPHGGDPAASFTFPYADEDFDYTLAMSVFSHMRPDGMARYLAEASRVLRPGGRLLATYFVVDPAVEGRLATGETDFALDHEMEDASGTAYLVSDPRVPEYNVGHHRSEVEAALGRAGLLLEQWVGGWWSRSSSEPHCDAFYQDLLIASKPPASDG